jgi:hypothetical protein
MRPRHGRSYPRLLKARESHAAAISGKECRICAGKTCPQRGTRPPSHGCESPAIEELTRYPIGTRRIKDQLPLITDDLGNQLGKFRDTDLLPAADIDMLIVRIMLENEHTGIRKIVYKEKFAQRCACPPHRNRGDSILLGKMKPLDQCRHDMTVLGVIVIARTIQVGRHHGNKIGTVLATIGLAQFNPGNLGDRVPLIAWLERPGQQFLFAHRLACQFRIDAGGAEEQQLPYGDLITGMNRVSCDRQIL